MISFAVSIWLASCSTLLPPSLQPRPVARPAPIPKVGIPEGEVPTDVSPHPKLPKKDDDR